jgi:hypothetical protein
LDGFNFLPNCAVGGHQTSTDWDTIQEHCAGSTIARIATNFDIALTQVFAKQF